MEQSQSVPNLGYDSTKSYERFAPREHNLDANQVNGASNSVSFIPIHNLMHLGLSIFTTWQTNRKYIFKHSPLPSPQ